MLAAAEFADAVWPFVVTLGIPITLYTTRDTSWPHYRLAHAWLATAGRVPWRLQTFLDRAQNAGLLRRVGAGYEFRHERLRQHVLRLPNSGMSR